MRPVTTADKQTIGPRGAGDVTSRAPPSVGYRAPPGEKLGPSKW